MQHDAYDLFLEWERTHEAPDEPTEPTEPTGAI